MKRLLGVLLLAGLAAPLTAQPPLAVSFPLFIAYDLDGEAADDDQVVVAELVVDNTNATIAAQPETCSTLITTLTDADDSVSAGTVTITGTDGDGNFLSDVSSALGDAVGNDTDTTPVFCTVTQVRMNTFTGEAAGDTIKVGTATAPIFVYPIAYGPQTGARLSAASVGNPDAAFQPGAVSKWHTAQPGSSSSSGARVETVGHSVTVVSSTGGSSDLKWVDIGDLIRVRDNLLTERTVGVVTNADNDTVTVDQALNLGTDGVGYSYKLLDVFQGARSGWFPVGGAAQVTITLNVNANADEITYQLECRQENGNPAGPSFIAVGPNTIAAGADPTAISIVESGDYSVCRLGLRFTTGDTGDTPVDSLDAFVTVRR